MAFAECLGMRPDSQHRLPAAVRIETRESKLARESERPAPRSDRMSKPRRGPEDELPFTD